ncbi:MAG: hypothetical protein HY870_06280, partial [Chloroflexi bacterium]|nr:hypothetical protein [Chloroflexota bacterium]
MNTSTSNLQRRLWLRTANWLTPWSGQALLPVLIAVVVWALALPTIDVRRMTDLGLLSVFPVSIYLALALLTLGFCLAVQRPQTPPMVLAIYVIVLIVIIHGTPNILYGTLRYSWAWKHVGIVDYIQRHGSVNPEIAALDAYHDWPGFFAFNALLTEAAGFTSALAYAGWAPVFFNLLNFGALLLLLSTFTTDRRLIWLSVWIFFLSNWVGQDYFSPQALSFFFYLISLYVCLKWFSAGAPRVRSIPFRWRVPIGLQTTLHKLIGDRPLRTPEPAAAASSPLQRVGLMLIVILIFLVMTSSHQLTPFMTISALAVLVIFRRCNATWLPVLMTIILALWILYGAEAFLLDRLEFIFSSVGQFASNLDANLIDVNQISAGQRLVSLMGRALTGGLWLLAVLGGLRRMRQGHRDWRPFLLLIAVLSLPLINSYGGEILFRVYLFALPSAAFFAAALIYPDAAVTESRRTPWVAVAVSAVLLIGFVFAYYGKDRQYYFTPNEVAAAEFLYGTAPPNSLLIEGTRNYPT